MGNPSDDIQQGTKKAKRANKSAAAKPKLSKKPKKLYHQTIFRDWCKACRICIAFCPKKVIGKDETGAPVIEWPDACIGCRFCELHCPDFAITITERGSKKSQE
jgi:2-oxoglutarate ferredoxin oxidoreductase subunit delta